MPGGHPGLLCLTLLALEWHWTADATWVQTWDTEQGEAGKWLSVIATLGERRWGPNLISLCPYKVTPGEDSVAVMLLQT